jgi:hypothetical protein
MNNEEEFEWPPPPPPLGPQHQTSVTLSLPAFWSANASGWFAHVESRFRTRRIFDEWDRFDLIVAALDSETILSVHHLVTSPPEDEPYTALKQGLLHNHQLTDYQRIEKLFAVETLGSRKPTQMLSQMVELCPEGEQQSKFFVFLFLHRLPGWLRIMLGDDDHQDVHALAVKADKLQALYGHLQHGAVAAVEGSDGDGAVNAVKGGGFKKGRGGNNNSRGRGGSRPAKSGAAPSTSAAAAEASTSPAALAQDSAGLCYYHWTYGEKASRCRKPCSWQGN